MYTEEILYISLKQSFIIKQKVSFLKRPNFLLVAHFWLTASYLLLVDCYFLLVARCFLLDAITFCSLLVTFCSMPFARCVLLFGPSYVVKVKYKLKKNTMENVLIGVVVDSAKTLEHEGSISPSSFSGQLSDY